MGADRLIRSTGDPEAGGRSRWRLEPHIRTRRLGRKALAYHIGSGDTHLLSPLSGRILDILARATDDGGCRLGDILADNREEASESEVTDALTMLAEAGIVRADRTQ